MGAKDDEITRLKSEQHRLRKAHGEELAAVQQVGATLLHKDPEFRAIPSLAQEWLG